MYTVTSEKVQREIKQIEKDFNKFSRNWQMAERIIPTISNLKVSMVNVQDFGRRIENIYTSIATDARNNGVEVANHPAFATYKKVQPMYEEIANETNYINNEYISHLLFLNRIVKEGKSKFTRTMNSLIGAITFTPEANADKAAELLTPELKRIANEYKNNNEVFMFKSKDQAKKLLDMCSYIIDGQNVTAEAPKKLKK